MEPLRIRRGLAAFAQINQYDAAPADILVPLSGQVMPT